MQVVHDVGLQVAERSSRDDVSGSCKQENSAYSNQLAWKDEEPLQSDKDRGKQKSGNDKRTRHRPFHAFRRIGERQPVDQERFQTEIKRSDSEAVYRKQRAVNDA